jgi:hypothetical protein
MQPVCANVYRMSATAAAHAIYQHLQAVDSLRAQRAARPPLARAVQWVKEYQHSRFARTYADLLASPRYAPAARFFLDELYGPRDYSQRDQQFARVVPALVRLFPHEIVLTVQHLAELHALSETLDTAMAQGLVDDGLPSLDAVAYGKAWRECSTPSQREAQVQGVLEVGWALDRYTRRRWLRHSLRLMRAPAAASGLSALQRFLETGFDTFGALDRAQDFLDTVAERERGLIQRLFAGEDPA